MKVHYIIVDAPPLVPWEILAMQIQTAPACTTTRLRKTVSLKLLMNLRFGTAFAGNNPAATPPPSPTRTTELRSPAGTLQKKYKRLLQIEKRK